MVKCPYCNQEYDDNMEYCPFCGGDNLQLDGFKKHGATQSNVAKPVHVQVGPIPDNIKIRTVNFTNLTIDLEYDLNDPFEKSEYEKVSDTETKAGSKKVAGIVLFAIFALMITIGLTNKSLISLVYIALMLFIPGICIALIAVRTTQIDDLAYLRYLVEKRGGTVTTYEEGSLLAYEINGQKHKIELRKGKYHYPNNY